MHNCGGFFDIDQKLIDIADREQQSEQPGFWDDNVAAQKVMQEIAELKEWVQLYEQAAAKVDDSEALITLAEEAGDATMEQDIDAEILSAEKSLEETEIRKILSGENDERNAILTINAGAGGTEAQDWAEMLMRMYTRWAERHG